MTTQHDLFTTLSDDDLVTEVKRLATAERRATAALVRALMELDARRLYRREGCSSLFTYCTQVLRLEEGAAYNRIEVARAARRFPVILDGLEDGSLTLTAARLLAPHLRAENHREVLTSAQHKSKRDVERLIAALAPRPDAPVVIRRLPGTATAPMPRKVPAPTASMAAPDDALASLERPSASLDQPPALVPLAPSPIASRGPRPAPTPLAPGRVKLQVTISENTHEKLRRAQDLARHAIPNGDLEAILDRALTLLVEDLERRRFAETSSPRAGGELTPGSRHIPAAVRRAVWTRDGGRCAFVGAQGRCAERGFLEFHHVQPHAAGGAATVANVSLRCRTHNQHEASLFFGVEGADSVREAAAEY